MLTGVSSAHNTSSPRNAVRIASSKPVSASRSANRSCARATNPVKTGAPDTALACTGTLPREAKSIAAAFTFGPYTTVRPARTAPQLW